MIVHRGGNSVGKAAKRPILHVPTAVGILVLVGLVGGFGSYQTYLIIVAILYGISALGLNIPAGMLGQLSLGQGVAFGMGAYAAAVCNLNYNWPILPSCAVAICAGLAFGAVIGIPAGRMGAIGFGMVTVGASVIFSQVVLALPSLTGGANGRSGISAGLIDLTPASAMVLYLSIVVVGAVAYVAHWKLRMSKFGRASLAIRDDPVGAAAMGIHRIRYLIIGSAIGAGFAGLAGGLYAFVTSTVSPEAFGLQLSLLLLLMVIFGGPGTIVGPVIGAAVVGLVPIFLTNSPATSAYVYGGLLIVVVQVFPRGIVGKTSVTVGDSVARSTQLQSGAPGITDRPKPTNVPLLVVSGVSRSFGGVAAVSDVSFDLAAGEVLALIGPNGSGKTTTLNLLSGYYPPSLGRIVVAGRKYKRISAADIAGYGVARTFQVPRLFPSLSLSEHIALAHENAPMIVPSVVRYAEEYLASLDFVQKKWRSAADALSHGERRFLEVGLALLRGPSVLLLDEPAAGLSSSEADRLGDLIAAVAGEGVGILLVEHHIEFVEEVADRVLALNLGQKLWMGDPRQIRETAVIVDSYLGAVER